MVHLLQYHTTCLNGSFYILPLHTWLLHLSPVYDMSIVYILAVAYLTQSAADPAKGWKMDVGVAVFILSI